jgi:hypothetical protein
LAASRRLNGEISLEHVPPSSSVTSDPIVEASTVAVEHRLLASKLLPALHRDIDISRRESGAARSSVSISNGADRTGTTAAVIFMWARS